MFEWSDSQLMIRDAVRRFVDEEIVPHVKELEHGDLPPYDILRKMYTTFGMGEMARARFEKQVAAEKRGEKRKASSAPKEPAAQADQAAATLIPIIELCRHCPGMVTAMGVSVGLTAGAILSKGTVEQKERWAPDLLTLDKVGAWAITEPGSGSDAFGGMRSSARREGDEFVLNGSKTFITNGPHADTTVFICKLEEADVDPRDRKILNFVLDRGMPGFEQSGPLRKMGMHSSPTGELFLKDVRVGMDRLLGGNDALERSGYIGAAPFPVSTRKRQGDLSDRAFGCRRDGAGDRGSLPGALGPICTRARAVRAADRRIPIDPGQAGAHGSGANEPPEPGLSDD